MAKIMYNQKWFSINEYPLDYFELLYQYYAAFGIRTPVTYYNFDLENSVADKTVMVGGAYETIGDLSGYLWRKILMLPIYNFEQISFNMSADETGVTYSDNTTTFFIPASYELQPRVNDFFIYDQMAWRDDPFNADLPIYQIVNIEKSSESKISFYKVSAKVYGKNRHQLDNQISGNFTFVDYEKQIYKTDDAIILQKFQLKNGMLPINNFFRENCGLYLEDVPIAEPSG